MRNALILVGLWVGIILTAFTLVYLGDEGPTPAQLALIERMADRTVVDPEGRYQFELPPGWRVASSGPVTHLAGPLGRMEAWITFVEGADVPQALRALCETVDPCPGKEIEAVDVLDPPAFASAKERITYTTETDEVALYGIGYALSDGTLVLLVRGDPEAVLRRQGELDRLDVSISLPESPILEEADTNAETRVED